MRPSLSNFHLFIVTLVLGLGVAGILFSGSPSFQLIWQSSNRDSIIESSIEPLAVPKGPIVYDLSCLNDENDVGFNPIISLGREIEKQSLEIIGPEVAVEEEMRVGKELKRELDKEATYITTGEKYASITQILSRLLAKMPEAKGFNYQIHLIKSDEINAFTAGAQIFVTTGIYDFCTSKDELACIIGHEIYHNELGHIKKHIQKEKLLTEIGAGISRMLTIPFGQEDETMCDLKGVDLSFKSGYDACVSIKLWQRMKVKSREGDYDAIGNLFRSHPYSQKRADCIFSHINSNYGIQCRR